MSDIYDPPLATISEKGKIPDSVLGDAAMAQATVRQLINSDQTRSRKRALAKGLVDGNPPYNSAKQRESGMSDKFNVNWRIAESYLNAALTAFYDLFSESPTYATVDIRRDRTMPESQTNDYAQTITRHFDWLQKQDKSWDYNIQISQYEMVLFGSGPMMFEDRDSIRCRAIPCGDLKVLERTRSDTTYWPMGCVFVTYRPDELYSFIANPDAARDIGWNVAGTKKAIIRAHPKYESGGQYLNWEWHQQQIKNGAFNYSGEAKSIFCAHLFAKEFARDGVNEGRITHRIVLADDYADFEYEYLFNKTDQHRTWNEIIHPMYYDHGGGGYHHSVVGMGIKMYSAMEAQNRILCNLADKVFAPKILFKPTTANDKQKFNLLNMGEYGVMSANHELQQTSVAGFMNDGLAFNRELGSTIASNLSQYRQNLQRESGNPITASESNLRASEQARLGKTQLNRYYAQLDNLYEERYRRATNPNVTIITPGGRAILEFQRRCVDDGVPRYMLKMIESVRATRVVGQGSIYLRQQSLEFLLGLMSMLPETGRDKLLDNVIASRVGFSFVEQFNPKPMDIQRPTDQHAFAMSQVADMKVGVAPVVTDTQNAVIYAQTFLQAGAQAAASLQQGADPMVVHSFMDLCGQAIAAHISKLAKDPTRKQIYDVLNKQFEQLAKINDQLTMKIQQDMQAQQAQQAEAQQAQAQAQGIASGQDPKVMIKAAETAAKIKQQQIKTDAGIQMKAQKHAQSLALADASSAAKINREASTKKTP